MASLARARAHALAHQQARGPHLFFHSLKQLIKSFVSEKTDLISIAENLINEKNSGYTVVFSILQFGNHVKKFGSNFQSTM